ncbi:major facilitator superfamily protein [Candidatus Planktophila vernalis]|uniref:Major facilitator superfamily protein n=1 Tax=Candidatus Planktophila vernalis TaxID=1884907 RepID=A0A249KSA5_9ACTN|nr:MFS transporter [Candidatus Planktophila vernalis]ASY19664.1 major facilitator superfamily protein [Candidatus Planktophila vernalis]
MSKKLGSSYWKLWTATAISNLGDGVSMVAYPWLASAVTRSPILIAAAGFASRLPWLIFTLHAGVLTDRFDRRKLIVAMDFMRGLLTVFVGLVVFFNKDSFPALDELTTITNLETNWPIYFTLLITAFLFGLAEVLRDNSAQTLMPSVVDKENLEKANGRMWSAESLTNSFIGPPLGSLLIGIAIFIPFFFDAVSFFFAVALIASLKGTFKPVADDKPREKINFKAEIKEGYVWLWAHPLLRPMAIILGSMNGLGTMVGATFILFAQEVLETSVFTFALLGTAGAVGGTVGGLLAPKISAKLGSGRSLAMTLAAAPIGSLIIALTTTWQVVWVVVVFETFFAILWNTITVSLRQSIIPTHLLGRVNSVYRFFAWGSIPIGMFVGGGLVSALTLVLSRENALRAPYLFGVVLGLLLWALAAPRLTTAKIEAARKAG